MTLNFPGPYEVRLNYQVTIGTSVLLHQARYNCDVTGNPAPGTAFAAIQVNNAAGLPLALSVAVDAWIAVLQPLFNAANTSFIDAELWKYTPLSFEADFVSVYNINLPGTAGGANVGSGQLIWTFRTLEGNIMKVSLLEATTNAGPRLGYAAQTAQQKALVDSILSNNNIWMARDTSFPFSHIALFPGQSEAVFKKRNRPD